MCDLSKRARQKQTKIKKAVGQDLNFPIPMPICSVIMQSCCLHLLIRNLTIFCQSSSPNVLGFVVCARRNGVLILNNFILKDLLFKKIAVFYCFNMS